MDGTFVQYESSLYANSVASHSLPETTNCDISFTPKLCVNSLFLHVGCHRLRLLLGPSMRPRLSRGKVGPDLTEWSVVSKKVTLPDSFFHGKSTRTMEGLIWGLFPGLHCQGSPAAFMASMAVTGRESGLKRYEGQSLLRASTAITCTSTTASQCHRVMY